MKRSGKNMGIIMFRACVVLLLMASSFGAVAADAAPANDLVKIGVLANRGPERCLEKWSPTSDYLTNAIPGQTFVIVPVDFKQIHTVVQKGEVDLILANPSFYVKLEILYGAGRIATLKNRLGDKIFTKFGSVVFCRKERGDIDQYRDLKGKAVMAVEETSLGGWRAAWREFKAAGIDPFKDFAALIFGGTHDAVVYAVRDAKVDVGIVRTDLLERMAQEGLIKLDDFKVVHQHGGGKVHLPFLHSTREYPEWPMAKVKHTTDSLAERVAVVLLQMPTDAPAALAAGCAGWTIPLNYQPVHECLKELKIGPYKDFGKITFGAVVEKYRLLILIDLAALIVLAWLLSARIKINRRLKTAHTALRLEVDERRRSQERISHLNAVLRSIRNINLLMITQKDRDQLIKSVCENLVQNWGYHNAWIALFDGSKKFVTAAAANVGKEFSRLPEIFERGDLIYCCRQALAQPGILALTDPAQVCDDCPLKQGYAGREAMAIRLEYEDNIYGVIAVSVPLAMSGDPEEQSLFKEVAGDIAYALHAIESRAQKEAFETMFLQSQKMEAVGTLAVGVAHDFNNLLTTIIGNAELVSMDLAKNNPSYERLNEIIKAGSSAASLTRQLLAFSRKQIVQPVVLDLNTVTANMDRMLQRTIGEDVPLQTLLDQDLGVVSADPGQMEQVIVNLAVNAKDAMPQGGKLILETANVDLAENYFENHGVESVPGPYVMLAVSDTGSGMDKETRARIFEPFFTTKDKGKGTGLGLSTVYGIVKQSKGYVWAYSEPGCGTTFKVYLPRVEGDAVLLQEEKAPKVKLMGSEMVLIVEDDAALCKLIRNVLFSRGYHVLEAKNGQEALRIAEAHKGPIHLMISDVVMPRMSGRELAQRLHPLRPEMKVIYMSGYTDNAIVRHGVLDPQLVFMQKPFTPQALARKVREVLDQ